MTTVEWTSLRGSCGCVRGNTRRWTAASECNFHAERKSFINNNRQFQSCLLVSGLIFCIFSIFFGSLFYQLKNKLLQTTYILAGEYLCFNGSRLRASEDFGLFNHLTPVYSKFESQKVCAVCSVFCLWRTWLSNINKRVRQENNTTASMKHMPASLKALLVHSSVVTDRTKSRV